jgi:trehalose-phosphatase
MRDTVGRSTPDRRLPALARRLPAMLGASARAGQTILVVVDYHRPLPRPIHAPPDAWLPRLTADLAVLTASDKISLAIISRRSMADLRNGLGLDRAIYAASHGLDIAGPSIQFRHPAADTRRSLIEGLGQTLKARVGHVPGVSVRLDGVGVAVDFEDAGAEDVRSVDATVDDLTTCDGRLSVVRGDNTIDVLPTRSWGRSLCVAVIRDALRRRHRSMITTIYLGDDDAEISFRALRESTLTVKIGGGPLTWAACRLPDIESAHSTLAALAYNIESR